MRASDKYDFDGKKPEGLASYLASTLVTALLVLAFLLILWILSAHARNMPTVSHSYVPAVQVDTMPELVVGLTASDVAVDPQATLDALDRPGYRLWWPCDLSDPKCVPAVRDTWDWSPGPDEIRELSNAYPGRTWWLLNEPDRGAAYGAALEPEQAALLMPAYFDAVNGVAACCGTVVDAWGMTWLDTYLSAGGPAPDEWHVHIYAYEQGEALVNTWDERVDVFREWMVERDVVRPFSVSETGPMSQFDQAEELLRHVACIAYTDADIKSVAWWATHDYIKVWGAGSLMDGLDLTSLGQVWLEVQQNPCDAPTAVRLTRFEADAGGWLR